MPNWCSVVIRFYSKNKEQLEKMRNKFLSIIENAPNDDGGFGSPWLGNFADEYFPEIGSERVDCRGWVDGTDDIWTRDDYYVFSVWVQAAWGAKMGLWHEIVKRYYPDVSIAYFAEECGCEYFCAWDQTEGKAFCPEAYYVDGCIPTATSDEEYIDDKYGFRSVEEIWQFFDDKLPFKYQHTSDLSKLTEEIQQKLDEYDEKQEYPNGGYFVQIAEFEEVDPATFNFLY